MDASLYKQKGHLRRPFRQNSTSPLIFALSA
jgi:hypothetical protein